MVTRLDALLSAKHPLDKNSDIYLEGKDVIKVVHSLASGTDPGLFVFDQSTLIVHTNVVITKLSSLLNMSFICHEPQVRMLCNVPSSKSKSQVVQVEGEPDAAGAGGIDVQLLSVCLAALMALFRLPELCREVCVLSEIK